MSVQPYYDDGLVTVYRGDCAVIVPQLEPVDLLLTDPPYGIGEAAGKNKSRGKAAKSRDYGDEHWDDSPPVSWLLEMLRTPRRSRKRRPFRRTWWTATLRCSRLTFHRGSRLVTVDRETFVSSELVESWRSLYANIGDRLMLFGPGDDLALVEVVAMTRSDAATVRVLTDELRDGAVQLLKATGIGPSKAPRAKKRRERDASLLPAVRARRGA